MYRLHQSLGGLAARRGTPSAHQVLTDTARVLRLAGALRLAPRQAGWLQVQRGAVWLTRSGDPDDHVLRPGQRLWLRPGDAVVAEPWCAGQAVALAWSAGEAGPAGPAMADGIGPDQVPLRRRGAGLAVVLGGAGARPLAALRGLLGRLARAWAARSAAPSARCAQGRIKAGESIASSGACQ